MGRPDPTQELSDADLVHATRRGEEWAFEALFRRHAALANGLAFRLLRVDADVDDLVQDAFLSAFNQLDRLDNPQAFASWLASIVVRTAGKRLRRRRLRRRLGLVRTTPVDVEAQVSRGAPPDAVAELRGIYRAVAELPVQMGMVLVLRRVEGMTVPEVAEHMGLSPATVKRRLTEADNELQRRERGKT